MDPLLDGAMGRHLDHARTVDALTRLGYRAPEPADLADAAWLREDTLRRQADPAVRRYLD